jgi:hypothetical protein
VGIIGGVHNGGIEMIPTSELCPKGIQESLHLYIDRGIPPGDFLQAVLVNDLKEAVGRADINNAAVLCHIVAYCYNCIPSASWGSEEKVRAWFQAHRDRDEAARKPEKKLSKTTQEIE